MSTEVLEGSAAARGPAIRVRNMEPSFSSRNFAYANRDRLCLGLIHHSDRRVQYVAIRYTERLAEAGVVASLGSRGDSYDNALAESFNGLYKAELMRHRGPWRGLDDVEYATLEYVDWFNHRRLHGELGMLPPAEFEALLAGPAGPLLLATS